MDDNKDWPKLWEIYPHIWKTQGAFFSWLRGNLRRALWEKFPVKIEFKNKHCFVPPRGLETRAKTGAYCALTGAWTGKSRLEVDHIVGEASLKDWNDFVPFCLHLMTTDDNMQLVEKEAHKVKSYAERQGITFDEALAEKKAISFRKLKSLQQHETLTSLGICETIESSMKEFSTVAKRVDTYRNYLKGVENEC